MKTQEELRSLESLAIEIVANAKSYGLHKPPMGTEDGAAGESNWSRLRASIHQLTVMMEAPSKTSGATGDLGSTTTEELDKNTTPAGGSGEAGTISSTRFKYPSPVYPVLTDTEHAYSKMVAKEHEKISRQRFNSGDPTHIDVNSPQSPPVMEVSVLEWNALLALADAVRTLRRANNNDMVDRPRPDIAWRDVRRALQDVDELMGFQA